MDAAPVIPEFFYDNPREMLENHRRYYLMVNAIARRVRQLQLGDSPMAVGIGPTRDLIYTAQQEFLEDKLRIIPRGVDDTEELASLDVDDMFGGDENVSFEDDDE